MKKILISATLLIVMLASAMVLSSFTLQNTEAVWGTISSPVWRGYAYPNGAYGRNTHVFDGNSKISITVYPSDNSCGSYYAVKDGDDVHYTVKNNPTYDYNERDLRLTAHFSHYISVNGRDYFFRM